MAYQNQSTALMLDIQIKSNELQIDKSENGLLGRGGYGSVYLGKYKGEKVAVKMLSDSGDIPKTQRNDLKREAKRLRAVCNHPYILNLIGVVMETDNYSLVLEYMLFGTSNSFIKTYIVGVPVRVQFAYQIISAMAWLHSQNPPMKHLDLKAENVLINNNFVAKISDFGLSEWKTVTMALSKTQQLSRKGPRCGTLSHIPPEVFRDINKKGAIEEDVYAFAITLWEIFTGKTPYANCGDKEDLIRGAVLNNQRPNLNDIVEDCPAEIKTMIQVSWDHNPMFRPKFKELEKKIEPVYNSVRNLLPDYFKYIRGQIVTLYAEDQDNAEHYHCTMHWSTCNDQELSNGQESVDAKPSTNFGSLNSEIAAVNGQMAGQNGAGNGHANEEIGVNNTEQIDADNNAEINYPPRIQANGNDVNGEGNSQTLVQRLSRHSDDTDAQKHAPIGYAAARPRLQNFQTQIENGQSNNTLAQVPIYETNQAGNLHFPSKRDADVGLSGFVSVATKQYTPGSQLSHPHGPIAQPASTVLENEPVVTELVANDPVANGNSHGEGRSGEEGDDNDDELFQGDTGLEELLLNLSVSNPGLYESLLNNPDALLNISRMSNGGQPRVENRPLEVQQRLPNSCTREVTQTGGTQLLTRQSVSVDQFSGQRPSSQRSAGPQSYPQQQVTQHLHSQQQQTGAVANSIRMHPAPDRTSNVATTQANTQQVVTAGPGAASQSQAFASPPIPLTQQKLPRQPVIQNVNPFQLQPQQTLQTVPQNQIPSASQVSPAFQHPRTGFPSQQHVTGADSRQTVGTSDSNQTIFGHTSQQTIRLKGQTTNVQPPQMPVMPTHSGSQQNVGVSQWNEASPVAARNQIRHGETSNRRDQQSANQANTGVPEPNRDETSEITASGRQKQPITILHQHAEGGVTTIKMDPDHEFPPNLQIGNKNVMVVNDNGGSKKKKEKKKKQKCKKSQLTTSTSELSMDHIDMIAVEIGKDWKRLCRQLDMTEADIEHLQYDFYPSGLYEIMYQGIQRWIQRNGRAATVRLMAEALWEIDRDDIALRLQ